MNNPKRLFLFAGYDRNGIIDCSLVYYIQSLSKIGDVIVVMDCDCSENEISKLSKHCINISASRHGEYDFGSYKRAYQYSKDNNLLNNYDYVYMVNDSVYGPLSINDFQNALIKLENSGADFIGMVSNEDVKYPKHIQSWFVGFSKKIVKNKNFDKFMLSITKENNKSDIVRKYEIGLSLLMSQISAKSFVLYEQNNHICNTVWTKPWVLIKQGIPFIKKSAIQHCFSYGFLQKVLQNDTILHEIKTKNTFIRPRPIKHILTKIFS